ncbi:MAG: 50S ribosomal protein L9 [Fidelibacterota bacterium]
MKVILTRAFEKLGQPGDIVDVKPGFARNYLFPNKIALTATKGNLKIFEEGKKRHKIQESKKVKRAQKVAEQLGKVSITATVAVGEEDKVFGSVTAQNIADLLKKKGFEIDKKNVLLDEPIKALGIYHIPIKLHHNIKTEIKVWVIKE